MFGELGGRGCPGCSGLGKPTGLLPAAVSWPHFGKNPWQTSSIRHSCGCSPWHGWWGQDPWCLAVGAALDTAKGPVPHLQLRSCQGLAWDNQQEVGRALPRPQQHRPQGGSHIDLYEWNPADIEESTRTDKFLFIYVDGLFQQGFHVSALSSGNEIFLFGYYYSMCSGCENIFFLCWKKQKFPKATEVLLDWSKTVLPDFSHLKKKWNIENRATIHIYVMNIQQLIDSQKFRCNEKWDIANKMLTACEELHPQQTPPSLSEVNSSLFAQMDYLRLQLS